MSEDRYGLKKKTREELVAWQAGWKPDSPMYLAAQEELYQREQAVLIRKEKDKQEREWWMLILALLGIIATIVFALLKLS
jgi:hypothetical protein